MSSEPFQSFVPVVHPDAWVHTSAQLLGDVALAEGVSVWPTAVLRGDSGSIRIGARSNIQDGTIVHATTGISRTTIGAECTVGHRVILHGCTVGDRCLIGMGSILLDNVEIGAESFVAAGSLIPPGKIFEPRSFVMGSPAKRIREVSSRDLEAIAKSWPIYLELARTYRGGSVSSR